MPHFPMQTVFVACGPDFIPEVTKPEPGDPEHRLADLLREHGPERVTVYAQMDHGPLEELNDRTVHLGRDDTTKYYSTRYTSPITGRYIDVGWDV
jgi:hypothetical protein